MVTYQSDETEWADDHQDKKDDADRERHAHKGITATQVGEIYNFGVVRAQAGIVLAAGERERN